MAPADVEIVVLVVAGLGLAVAAVSQRMDALPLSWPLLGLVAGVLAGPEVVGLVDVGVVGEGGAVLREVALVLLAVSMMAIALRYPWSEVVGHWRPVALLLVVAMPLMAMTSALVAWAVLGPAAGIGFATAMLLGAAVCPTDPVLASSVVTGDLAERDVSGRTRRLLSLESGANDGLALPLVVAAIGIGGTLTAGEAATEALRGALGGVLLGAGVGLLAARAVRYGEQHGATKPAPVLVFTIVLALGVLAGARLLGVGEVLAVFSAGLALNATWSGGDRVRAVTIDEAVNHYAVLPLFVLLGAALPWAAWTATGWPIVLLLVVGVMALRRVPLLLALLPLHLAVRDRLFLGWFGPVGVSGLYYLLEVGHRVEGAELIVTSGVAVVAASTVAHGLTGSPGRILYRRAGG